MQARISVITLGVRDLEKSLQFYREGLGLHCEGITGQEFEHGAVAFIELQSGLKLALWPQSSIQQDTGLELTPMCATQMTLGQNVYSPLEVDQVMAQAAHAGARIIKPAQATFYGGYAGYFQDPDDHVWEIVFNPSLELD
ncbi:VOC family protein [Acinetobacter haemolyticus]|uniref:VOC family protein n=1 Tax=unclassified Acinetobacter TaxID=196816 RepID=UPI001408BF21|nr:MULTISPECIES: VOC family protein [unclassified Acinetobacter]QQN39050.1 VOC family protein [Acinetobacter sp. CS-2]UDM38630.1 VOC family protein [Acinetobacter haemolyticus]